jgi:hypothetical protein
MLGENKFFLAKIEKLCEIFDGYFPVIRQRYFHLVCCMQRPAALSDHASLYTASIHCHRGRRKPVLKSSDVSLEPSYEAGVS